MQGANEATEQVRQSPLEDDCLAWKFVNKKRLSYELDLYSSKWFDYRHLSPLQATRLYIDKFADVYRRHFAAEIDVTRAQYVRTGNLDRILEGLSRDDAKDKARLNSYWNGRQVADALGMPYEVYINFALTIRLRYWKQRHLPKAQHLYLDWLVERVQEEWEKAQASKLYLSDEPVYLVQNYDDIAHQNDYHEWLFKQAWLRSNPAELMARFVREDRLPLEKVESRFEDHIIERVRRYLQ